MSSWLSYTMPHLVAAPILLPMFTAAILVAVREKYRKTRSTINVLSCLLSVFIAGMLISWVKDRDAVSAFAIYLTSNWDVPFGIPLLADRFSALMVLVASLIALAAALYATARWDRSGIQFQTLFQVQLMGINGAFLTADLFNLFVFFEILLAASYGLVLHGSGSKRVSSGMHYIAINLVASFFFLIGIALIYNTTGTLNLADIAQYVRTQNTTGQGTLYTGFAILAVAFLAKAAMWPLNFWLVPAYSAASAPAGAIFAVLTKVGMYVLLRLSCLFFASHQIDATNWFGNTWLTYGGLLTLFFGTLGLLGATRPSRLAAYATLVSSGTLMTIVSFGQTSLTSSALYYLPASTFAIATFFFIAELIERDTSADDDPQQRTESEEDRMISNSFNKTWKGEISVNLDEREEEIVGRAIPAAMAFLGVSFACCALLIAGLPPLSTFIAKFGMLNALINPYGLASSNIATISPTRWVTVGLIILSGLFALVGFSRAGIRYFWAPVNKPAPRLRVIEVAPIAILLFACLLLTMRAEISIRYTRATAAALYTPSHYINAIMSTKPLLTPTNQDRLAPSPAVPDENSPFAQELNP